MYIYISYYIFMLYTIIIQLICHSPIATVPHLVQPGDRSVQSQAQHRPPRSSGPPGAGARSADRDGPCNAGVLRNKHNVILALNSCNMLQLAGETLFKRDFTPIVAGDIISLIAVIYNLIVAGDIISSNRLCI